MYQRKTTDSDKHESRKRIDRSVTVRKFTCIFPSDPHLYATTPPLPPSLSLFTSQRKTSSHGGEGNDQSEKDSGPPPWETSRENNNRDSNRSIEGRETHGGGGSASGYDRGDLRGAEGGALATAAESKVDASAGFRSEGGSEVLMFG